MSLKYDFFLKGKIIEEEPIEQFLREKNVPYSKKTVSGGIYFDANEELGFEIYIFMKSTSFFDYMINDTYYEYEWENCTCISFDVNKFFDNQKVRLNMLELTLHLLKNNLGDAILLFNGDVLILDRKNGKVNPNLQSDFWKSKDLLTKLKSLE